MSILGGWLLVRKSGSSGVKLLRRVANMFLFGAVAIAGRLALGSPGPHVFHRYVWYAWEMTLIHSLWCFYNYIIAEKYFAVVEL